MQRNANQLIYISVIITYILCEVVKKAFEFIRRKHNFSSVYRKIAVKFIAKVCMHTKLHTFSIHSITFRDTLDLTTNVIRIKTFNGKKSGEASNQFFLVSENVMVWIIFAWIFIVHYHLFHRFCSWCSKF